MPIPPAPAKVSNPIPSGFIAMPQTPAQKHPAIFQTPPPYTKTRPTSQLENSSVPTDTNRIEGDIFGNPKSHTRETSSTLTLPPMSYKSPPLKYIHKRLQTLRETPFNRSLPLGQHSPHPNRSFPVSIGPLDQFAARYDQRLSGRTTSGRFSHHRAPGQIEQHQYRKASGLGGPLDLFRDQNSNHYQGAGGWEN